MFTDGSLLEGGNVGGVRSWSRRGERKKRLNAELWTSQRCGMERWFVWQKALPGPNGGEILILAYSKAAIAAVSKAGRMGKARSSHLRKVVDEIGARGPGMVKVG